MSTPTEETTAEPGVLGDNAASFRKTLTPRNFLGDALTAISFNIIVNLSGMMTYFYTDIMRLAAGAVGTAMLAAKIADALTDVGMGVIVDRTKSKYGKARPWFLRMALPALAVIILMFTMPAKSSPEAEESLQIAYVVISNFLLIAIVGTAIAVPYGSMFSLATANPHERSRMGLSRLLCAYAAGTAVSSLLVPSAKRLGGDQRAFIIMGVIFGAAAAVTLAGAFLLTRENNVIPPAKGVKQDPLPQRILFLFKNRYWVLVLGINVLVQIIYAVAGIETYYVKYIFHNVDLSAVTGLFRMIFMGGGFLLSTLFVKKLGKRNLIIIGSAVSVAGYALRALFPYDFSIMLAGVGIGTLGGVPAIATMGAMIADSIEYGEWKTGKRTVGIASSTYSFSGKLAAALWAGATGWLLGASGYDGIGAQTLSAIQSIIALNIYVPLICQALTLVLMLFYDLDRDYARIVGELNERRARRKSEYA